MLKNLPKYISEVIGTFVLVLFGCGAAVFGGSSLGIYGIAMAFGLSVVVMAYSIGTISGCHVNPAVSLAMFINKRMKLIDFICYVVSQLIGAFLASAAMFAVFKMAGIETITAMGENAFNGFQWWGAFAIELVLTFLFVLVVMTVTGKKSKAGGMAGLAIGLALALVHIGGIPLTGTSVNPARSLAPAVFMGAEALKEVWVFIVAPFAGAALAAVTSKFVFKSETEEE